MITIEARTILENMNYDLSRMLKDNTSTKKIVRSMRYRLDNIRTTTYQKIKWD